MSAKDNLSYSSEPSYVGQTNYDKDYIPPTSDIGSINQGLGPEDNEMTPRAGKSKQNGGDDINTALDEIKKMEDLEKTSLLGKAAVKDIGQQVTSQLSKLDQMINKADRAQTSLNNQNKQMRTFLR